MIEKMRKMDQNPEGYVKTLNICLDVIKPDWIDGTLVVNGIFRRIAENLGWQENTDAAAVENIFTHFAKDVYEAK